MSYVVSNCNVKYRVLWHDVKFFSPNHPIVTSKIVTVYGYGINFFNHDLTTVYDLTVV